MRKGRDGEKNGKNGGKKKREKTDDYSGHYVIASSRPPERRALERRTLAPKNAKDTKIQNTKMQEIQKKKCKELKHKRGPKNITMQYIQKYKNLNKLRLKLCQAQVQLNLSF